MEIRVSIYERLKQAGKWREIPVRIPPSKIEKDGSLFAKDNRRGTFVISWCDNRKKKRQAVRDNDGGNVIALSDALSCQHSAKEGILPASLHPGSDR